MCAGVVANLYAIGHYAIIVIMKHIEKVKLNLWIPKALIVSGRVYRLNFSQLLTKSLQNFFNKQEIDPNQLLEDIFNEKQDKRDERREFYRKRAKEFWEGVYYRRTIRKKEKYIRIGKIIEEKRKRGIPDGLMSQEEREFIDQNERATSEFDLDDEDEEEEDWESSEW